MQKALYQSPQAFVLVALACFVGLTSSLVIEGIGGQVIGAFSLSAAVGVILWAVRLWRQSLRTQMFRSELTGRLLDTQVDAMINAEVAIDRTPRERHLTMMMVEVGGFSATVEKMPADQAFKLMHQVMDEFTNIALSYGAYVNRMGPDSLMAYFGHDLVPGNRSDQDNIDQAITCAMAIQRFAFGRNLGALATKEPILPIKIGINTANVFWGGLELQGRRGYAAIGVGVYFTTRLAAVCEPYRMLVSQTSWYEVQSLNEKDNRVTRKIIQSKQTNEEFEAIEVLCLGQDQLTQMQTLNKAYRDQTGMARGTDRHAIPRHLIRAFTAYGGGEITNISPGGCCLKSREYLAKGFTLDIELKTLGLGFEAAQAYGEVRWTESLDGGYFLHGIQFRSTSPELEALISGLLSRRKSGEAS